MMGKRFWNLFKISAAIRKAVTTLQAPTSDWKIYPARILYTTDFYEKAQSRLEKTADTLNIETDTEEKKGTKQKRKTAMTFSESDKDIVVGDEELYRRYYFDSSNSQRTSNVILNIAEKLLLKSHHDKMVEESPIIQDLVDSGNESKSTQSTNSIDSSQITNNSS
ncbi:uncharacterized protein LOC136091773 [Hydra vulgaris]|uniref:Uncharacterized protein LOC136091773 n=1 Tax=Hydra vulgaris TaxID=6087 RepID=A0ABM4DLX7_HYDVU